MHNQLIDEANLAMVNHTVLLTSDGKAKLFGCTWQRKWLCHQKYHRPLFAPLFAPPEIPDVTSTHVIYTQASPGGFHVALLRSDGKVVIIGCNDSGQCNIPPELDAGPTTPDARTRTPPPNSRASSGSACGSLYSHYYYYYIIKGKKPTHFFRRFYYLEKANLLSSFATSTRGAANIPFVGRPVRGGRASVRERG